MLFSEPKIPQFEQSARRADGSSIVSVLFSEPKIPQPFASSRRRSRGSRFQCSSASRKFLNITLLLRIETVCVSVLFSEPKIPQPELFYRQHAPDARFSALQRAENSSTWEPVRDDPGRDGLVSVLFSEPKIPQLRSGSGGAVGVCEFQCSSASRKFLNGYGIRG